MVWAGWGTVLKRMQADGLIVAAALVTIILAIILLASGPIFTSHKYETVV